MKKIFLSLLFLLSAAAACLAAEKQDYKYYDAANLHILGKITPDTYSTYSRFPERMKDGMRKPVWNLGLQSAGIAIRFRSDAGDFMARWSTNGTSHGDNMSYITQSGMALYVLDKGEWVFVSCFRPGRYVKDAVREFHISCSKLKGQEKEYMVYLGTYDGFRSIELGVPAGYHITMPKVDSPRAANPVIAYGTSILQGASASHPGLAGTNLLSRLLDRQVINMGFSGNAKLDMDVAEYLASYPAPGAYILDNAPNCVASLILERQEEFYRVIRKAHPETPVFFVGMPLYPRVRFDEAGAKDIVGRRDAMLEVYRRLRKSGEKNIYYLGSEKILLDDNVGTIEGTHFTDVAFRRWADMLAGALKGKIKDN